MAKQTDTSWNTEKLEQVAAVLREADQILVGVGGGFNLAAGVEELPLDKKLNENAYWPFWLPYIKKQRLNKEVPGL